MWRVSHCLHIWSHWTTNKTTLVRLLPIASPPLRLIRTWCTSPDIHFAAATRAYLISMNYWRNLITIVESHIGLFSRAFPFVELIVGARSFLFLADICLPSPFSSLYFFSLLSFASTPGAVPLSQLFSAKLSRSLRVAICFDRGSHP